MKKTIARLTFSFFSVKVDASDLSANAAGTASCSAWSTKFSQYGRAVDELQAIKRNAHGETCRS